MWQRMKIPIQEVYKEDAVEKHCSYKNNSSVCAIHKITLCAYCGRHTVSLINVRLSHTDVR